MLQSASVLIGSVILCFVMTSRSHAYQLQDDDAALTPDYLLAMGEKFNDTVFQLIGQTFYDVETTLREHVRNHDVIGGMDAITVQGNVSMPGNKTVLEHVCELLECTTWSQWSNCVINSRTLDYGMVNRSRSCGLNTSLCSYPRNLNRVEKHSKVCGMWTQQSLQQITQNCPPSFMLMHYAGESFCLFFETTYGSKYDGVEACHKRNATLANVNSKAKHDAVSALFQGSVNTVWIDGQRPNINASWFYTYGAHITYENWHSGEPSDGADELCVVYAGNPKERWDRACQNYYAALCEFPLRPERKHGQCPVGWTQISQSCYIINTRARPWDHAKEWCEYYGGHLMDINTAAEHSALISLWRSQYSGEDQALWVGARDWLSNDFFRWSDRSPVGDGFELWWPGEPDNWGSQSEDCAKIRPFYQYKMSDAPCIVDLWSICEIDL